MFLQPRHVTGAIAGLLARAATSEAHAAINDRGLDRFAQPLVDFRVSVSEGESSGSIVVARRKVNYRGRRAGLGHLDRKLRVIDTIRMFV